MSARDAAPPRLDVGMRVAGYNSVRGRPSVGVIQELFGVDPLAPEQARVRWGAWDGAEVVKTKTLAPAISPSPAPAPPHALRCGLLVLARTARDEEVDLEALVDSSLDTIASLLPRRRIGRSAWAWAWASFSFCASMSLLLVALFVLHLLSI